MNEISHYPRTLVACALLLLSLPIHAADPAVNIPRIEREPTLDDFAGMTPATGLARSMVRIGEFIQRQPDDGEPATQPTDAFLGYDAQNLYAVFLAFDSNPGLIRANMSSRENITGDDSMNLVLDTFNDQRTAISFRSNPLGVQWDARWTEGSSQRGGFDTSLEAVWYSEGEVTESGYMVRITVPWRSLRFPDREEQLWRVQFARNIPRLDERSYWPEYSLAMEGRLNQTALLSGISNVSPGNNFQIIPFLFAREADSLKPDMPGGPSFASSSEQEIGLDAKWVFNDSMALDFTLNPDFSQVESDEPQVTVNERFEVQFPERRPFFIENADFFATDSTLVFTRRIVDPEGGIRLTGRSGNYGFGTILINDEAPGLNRPAGDPLAGEKANIGIVRGFRDISNQDRVGFLLSDRELGEGFNRVASIDGRFRLSDNWITQLQLVGTDTEPVTGGESRTGYQRNIQVNRAGRNLNTHTHFIETTADFRTDLGFQNRFFKADTSGIHNRAELVFFPEALGLNNLNVNLFGVYMKDMADTRIFTQLGPGWNLNWNTNGLGGSWTDYTEVLRPGDFPGLNQTRVYDYDNWSLNWNNSSLSTLEFRMNIRGGTALNLVPPLGFLPSVATTRGTTLSALWRPVDRLRVDNTYLRTELNARGSGTSIFVNEIMRSNWNYQFSRELSLRFIAQHNETEAGPLTRLQNDKNLNFDLLLRYVINPWSAFYVGYNSNRSNFDIIEFEGETELVVSDHLREDGEQLFVKFSYLFQR